MEARTRCTRISGARADSPTATRSRGYPRDKVRRCANPECGWLFLDDSRAGKRRWCSMLACGNRAKARRHYHRSREQ